MFGEVFETEVLEHNPVTNLGTTLWEMIYLIGKRKR